MNTSLRRFTPFRFEPVGRCVYCGTSVFDPKRPQLRLSTEHIVPEGIGGNHLLPEASCHDCGTITSSFELTVQRKAFGPIRYHLRLPTKRPKNRPEVLPFTLIDADGTRRSIDVPVGEYPLMIALARMSPPRILAPPTDGDRQIDIIAPNGTDFVDAQIAKLANEHGAVSGSLEMGVGAGDLRLALAKIAHCYAVARFRKKGFQPFLADLIRRKDEEGLKLFVGAALEPAQREEVLHFIDVKYVRRGRQKLIVFTIALFGRYGTPSYDIVVGRLNDNFPALPKIDGNYQTEPIVWYDPKHPPPPQQAILM